MAIMRGECVLTALKPQFADALAGEHRHRVGGSVPAARPARWGGTGRPGITRSQPFQALAGAVTRSPGTSAGGIGEQIVDEFLGPARRLVVHELAQVQGGGDPVEDVLDRHRHR